MRARIDPKDAARRLGELLRGLGYSEDGIAEVLGDDGYPEGPDEVPALARRLDGGPLGTAIELLFLERPVARKEALRAFGRAGIEALEATGLAEAAGEVEPHARIIPVGDLLVAGDGFSKGADDPPDFVTSFSPTSRMCAALTPRRRVRTALDVGTGSGALALLAARHARRVVATDVNDRALAYTRLNAALNAIENIECRRGSLFEPVAGERFDLVTCNAPYVISPARRWAYRDGGHDGDELSKRVVEGAAAHLEDGGFATVNVSWLAADPDAPDERVLEWIDETRREAWVLVAWEADPLEHAAAWGSDLAGDSEGMEELLDEWTEYFDELDAGWISEGTVVLHGRAGTRRSARIDEIDPEEVEDASDQVLRAFAARERLGRLRRRADLLDLAVAVESPLRLVRERTPRRRSTTASVTLDEGTCSTVETTAAALDVLDELDGATVGAAVAQVARRRRLSAKEADALRREALRLTHELLELGALRFR